MITIELITRAYRLALEAAREKVEQKCPRAQDVCDKGCAPGCRHQWKGIGYNDARFDALSSIDQLLTELPKV